MNYKLTVQYDGTDFHGWQIQSDLRTVQGELTAALALIEGSDVTVHGSGRTDAGVHAEGQVANVILKRKISSDKLRNAINNNIGKDVRVMQVEGVSDDFHARYSAREKTYVYRILLGQVASPFWFRYAHQETRRLELHRMQSAAELFLGKHDWTAFSAAQSEVEDRVRTMTQLQVIERWEARACSPMVEITATADGFLRYMVRTIAGTLLAIGRGELNNEVVAKAIENGKRLRRSVTAQACGLTLLSVNYE